MKKLLIVGFAALALASCGTNGPTSIDQALGNPPTTQGTLLDERALLAAEGIYNAAGRLVEAAVDSGRLTGANAARVRQINRQAYTALQAARTAQRAGEASTYSAKVAEALTLIAQVQALARSD